MLEKVRKPSRARSFKRIFAYVLFGLICFSFVFLGLTPDRGGTIQSGGAAAYVNDVVISVADFKERVDLHERQAGERFKDLPAAQRQAESRRIRERALRELVDIQLRVQAAQKAGLFPADAAVRETILSIPAFQTDGQFDRGKYDNYLAYVRSTPAEFENKIRSEVVDNQLRQAFFKVMRNSAPVQTLDRELRDTKLNLEFVQFDPNSLQISAADADAKAFLAGEEGKAKVKDYYEGNKSEFTSRAEVRARHILIKPKGEDDKAWKAALDRIREIQKQVQTEDFGEVAAKVSEDEGSKSRKGDLNYFGRGQMVKEFEDAAFSQPVGQVGEPVKTIYGYHLIKVEGRRGGELKPLAQVELEIAKKLIVRDAGDRFTKELEDAVKNGQAVDKLLARQNLKWQETGEFDLSARFIPKIGERSEVLEAALVLKKPGEVSKQVVRSGGQFFVVRLKSLKTPAAGKADDFMNFTFSMGAIEAMNLWAQSVREKARISLNEALVQ